MEEKPKRFVNDVVRQWVREAYLHPGDVNFPRARYEDDDEEGATSRAVGYCRDIMAKLAVEMPELADILDSEAYQWRQKTGELTKYFRDHFWSYLMGCYEPIELPPRPTIEGIGFDLDKRRREMWLSAKLPIWPKAEDEQIRSLENWGGVIMLVCRTIQNPRNYFHGMSFGQVAAMPASLYTEETLLEVEGEMARRAELAKQQTQ